MTSRREFLEAAAAVSAATALTGSARAADGVLSRALVEPKLVVVDSRFAEAKAFGRRWADAGVPVREIQADVTNLWNGEINPLWAKEPAPIVGLTARPALFLLERLAWDHWRMRTVFHAEHARSANGDMMHVIFQGGGGLTAQDLARAGEAWPSAVAFALQGLPAPRRSERPTVSGMACDPQESMEMLASWVIAPITNVA